MLSVLGLRTEPNKPLTRGSTSASVPVRVDHEPRPLGDATIASTLQFLIPPSVHGIPSSIISRQLRNRHHFLSITPEDEASYFCLNPDHPSQNTASVLSTLHELADQNAEDLARSVLYSTDGEDILSHVITADPGAIQFVFIWETPDANDESKEADWKYLDVKPYSPSNTLYKTLHQAGEARLTAASTAKPSALAREASGNSIADDSYWSAYDNVAPSVSNGRAHFLNGKLSIARNESGTGLSQRSASPRREEAYWDRYGYDSDDEEGGNMPPAVIAPAPASFQAHAPVLDTGLGLFGPQVTRHIPAQIWTTGGSRFTPEDLSEALAMHLQPDLAPSSDVAQGLTVNLGTPPSKEPLARVASDPGSPLEGDQASTFSDPSVEPDTRSTVGINSVSTSEKAVADATRGIYNLWRSTRNSQGPDGGGSSEEKQAFIALVTRTLADL